VNRLEYLWTTHVFCAMLISNFSHVKNLLQKNIIKHEPSMSKKNAGIVEIKQASKRVITVEWSIILFSVFYIRVVNP